MYYVSKRMEIAGAHNLKLDYESKCKNIHGHNWIVTVHCKAVHLNHNSMVVDFKKIKELVHGKLDHTYINDVVEGLNPTAENIARWICSNVNDYLLELRKQDDGDGMCFKVEVQESEGNTATYIEE